MWIASAAELAGAPWAAGSNLTAQMPQEKISAPSAANGFGNIAPLSGNRLRVPPNFAPGLRHSGTGIAKNISFPRCPHLMNSLRASILVVDDEPEILSALREQLTAEGYEVTACACGADALSTLEQRAFSVIISDQRMPGICGLELMGHARKLHPHSSRVLLTGVLSLDTLVGAINQGEIFRFVAKPWMRAELLATVENAVQRHALLQANEQLVRNTEKLNRQLVYANAQLRIQLNELTAQKEQIDDAHEALNANFEHSLGLCYRIINTFDPLLGKQTKAVVDLCRKMAHLDDFTPEEKHVLIASAWLHDIGLIGLNRDVVHRFFHRPEELSAGDRALLREHPIYGQALAAFVDRLSAVGITIRAHHEHFDGTGYPDGLAGRAIPWTARCLAVAVAFVHPGKPRGSALQNILEQSGTTFDPEAVRVFLKTTHRTELPRQVREIPVEELAAGNADRAEHFRAERHVAHCRRTGTDVGGNRKTAGQSLCAAASFRGPSLSLSREARVAREHRRRVGCRAKSPFTGHFDDVACAQRNIPNEVQIHQFH